MIVSIARELGAGGGTVAEAVAASLGAALLDERFFFKILSERYAFSGEYLERALERPPRFFDALLASVAQMSATLPGGNAVQMPDEQLIDVVRTLVVEQAAQGHVVVVGHGGMSLFGWRPPDRAYLAVLLQAGREWRIDQLARRMALDQQTARRVVLGTDEARRRYQEHYFQSQLYDCSRYDLVINTERLGLDVAVDLVRQTALTIAQRHAAPAAP